MLIYLTRYGRLTPEYVEALDLRRFVQLVETTREWIEAENGKRSNAPENIFEDPAHDFE